MGGGSEIAVFSWRTHDTDLKKWKAWCKEWGKAWCFQLERGETTGRDHYQGVISLKVRRTVAAAKKIIRETSTLPEYFEPCSDNTRKAGAESFYVTKPETRVDGPWSDQDKEIFIPYQYQGILENLKPFQKKIWDSADVRDPRKINVVVDTKGASGKSSIAALMDIHGRAIDLPAINDADKIVASVCNILEGRECRDPKVLFFDLTRSQKQDQLFGLYTAIEQCKKGKVYDLRYHYKEWWFHSPQIWVFCNEAPHRGYLSHDRWNIWSITEEGDLSGATLEAHTSVSYI